MSETVRVESDGRRRSHWGRILVAIGALLFALVGLLTPLPHTGRAGEAIGDLVHSPLFGGLAFGLLCLLEQLRPLGSAGKSLARRCAVVFASLLTFGVGIELVQQFFGRTGRLHDAVANGLGILAAILVYYSWQFKRDRPGDRGLPRILVASAGLLIAMAWWTPAAKLCDVAAVHWDFPLLASFESPMQLGRFYFRDSEASLTRQDATDGRYAMELTFEPTSRAAAFLSELSPDWSAMQTFELDVTLDASCTNQEVRFVVKVVDNSQRISDGDTFHGVWTLVPGRRQHIRITREQLVNGPDSCELDLSRIQYVGLTVLQPSETIKLRVDALRLTL